jgi:hypothetical protein
MAFLWTQTCYRNFERSVEMSLKFKAGSTRWTAKPKNDFRLCCVDPKIDITIN